MSTIHSLAICLAAGVVVEEVMERRRIYDNQIKVSSQSPTIVLYSTIQALSPVSYPYPKQYNQNTIDGEYALKNTASTTPYPVSSRDTLAQDKSFRSVEERASIKSYYSILEGIWHVGNGVICFPRGVFGSGRNWVGGESCRGELCL
eukprot:scaffold6415_cov103-Alexandrium_tamarense.AAC.1